MSELLSGASAWCLGTALGGGAILFGTGLWVRRAPTAVARQRLGECGIYAALLVAVLRLGPAWLPIWEPHCEPLPCPPEPAASCAAPLAVYLSPSENSVPDSAAMPQTSAGLPLVSGPADPGTGWRWPIGLLDGMLLGYAGIAGFLVFRWLTGQWALARLVGRARPAPEAVQQTFDRLAAATGQPGVRLRVSERVPVPLCCGLTRPTVLIPRSLALTNDPTVLRWVFAHELTHLARRDPWSAWAMGLAHAVYFYVPWFYWLKRQVRLCQEYVADAAAAAQGPWADDYAQFLVSLARSPAAPLGATGVLGNTSDLYRRVTMLLQPTPPATPDWPRRKLVSGAACLIAAAVIFAGLGARAECPVCDKKEKEVKVTLNPVAGGDGEVVFWMEDDGEDKKSDKRDAKGDNEGKDARRARAQVFMTFDSAELEKQLRKAMESAKLSDEEVERIVKDVTKAMEKARSAMALATPKFDMVMPGQGGHWQLAPGVAGGMQGGQPGVMALRSIGGGGRLGVTIDKPGAALAEQLDLPKGRGLVIMSVSKDSAAEKAGLKANDILVRFADKDVSSEPTALIKLIEGVSADDEITAVVIRKGRKETIRTIKLPEKKKAAEGGLSALSPTEPVARATTRSTGDGKGGEKKSQRSVSVSVNDGKFTAKETDGDLTITVTGTTEDGKVEVSNVTINDGGTKKSYSSLDEVPSKYRARVKKLTDNSGDSPVKLNFRKEKSDNR